MARHEVCQQSSYSLFCITENTFYKAKSYVLISIMIRKYPFHCNGFINFIISLWNIFLYTKNQVLFILTEGRGKKVQLFYNKKIKNKFKVFYIEKK